MEWNDFEKKKDSRIEFEVPCYYYLIFIFHISRRHSLLFSLKSNKKLIGAKREGMLDVW